MKKILLIIGLMFTLSAPVFASNSNDIKVVLDGEVLTFDVPAQIINGRTMVPMRTIFEKLGATIEWDSESQTVSAYKPGISIKLEIGTTEISKNSITQPIDVPAMIVNDRTLVPVRVVSESMGSEVTWEQETQTVYITSTDNIQYIDLNDNYYYWGEVSDNKATGFGISYSKSDDSIYQMGTFSNSKISTGKTFFSSGDMFIGEYVDGNFSYGALFFYGDGEFYSGYIEGYWVNNLPNGICRSHDVLANIYFEGNYTNGLKDGEFVFTDLSTNTTYTKHFANDRELIAIPIITPSDSALTYPSQSTYQSELIDLNQWYDNEAAKIEEFADSDPFETAWGKKLMKTYENNAQEMYDSTAGQLSSMTGGFANSYSMQMAEDSKKNMISDGRSKVREMFQTEINNRWEDLENEYNRKLNALKIKYGV